MTSHKCGGGGIYLYDSKYEVVVVVEVGLFHTNLKYKYFYNDACIEMRIEM